MDCARIACAALTIGRIVYSSGLKSRVRRCRSGRLRVNRYGRVTWSEGPTGWRSIEGADYYFAALSDIPEQTWFYEAFDKALGETSFGKWVYKKLGIRSYGSLYQNEETPDGSRVDEAGRKIGATDQEGGRT